MNAEVTELPPGWSVRQANRYDLPDKAVSYLWWRWWRGSWEFHIVSFTSGKAWNDPMGFELERGIYMPILPPPPAIDPETCPHDLEVLAIHNGRQCMTCGKVLP